MMDLECPALQPPRLFFCPPQKIVVLPNQGGFTKRFSTDHALTFVGTFCHQKTFQVGGCFLGAFLCEHLNQGITSSFSTFKGGCQLKLIHGLPSGTVFKYANHTTTWPLWICFVSFFWEKWFMSGENSCQDRWSIPTIDAVFSDVSNLSNLELVNIISLSGFWNGRISSEFGKSSGFLLTSFNLERM